MGDRTGKSIAVRIRLPHDLDKWIKEADGEGNRTKTIIKALRRFKEQHDRRVSLPVMLNTELKALLALYGELNSWGNNLNQLAAKANANEEILTRQGISKDIHDMKESSTAIANRIAETIAYWRFS